MSDDAAYLRGQVSAVIGMWRRGFMPAQEACSHIEDIIRDSRAES